MSICLFSAIIAALALLSATVILLLGDNELWAVIALVMMIIIYQRLL